MKVNSKSGINVLDEITEEEKYSQNTVNNRLFVIANRTDIVVPSATIEALLSTFVDDVVAIFNSDEILN